MNGQVLSSLLESKESTCLVIKAEITGNQPITLDYPLEMHEEVYLVRHWDGWHASRTIVFVPKSANASRRDLQASETTRDWQDCIDCFVVGHMKYQCTSACPVPCIFWQTCLLHDPG